VLPAIYQRKYFPQECRKTVDILEFGDGTKLSYDSGKNHLEIDVVDKITLKVGKSSIEMTEDGIKLKVKRINLN
jgi:phage baseplate assembly protein gpV